MRATEFGKIVQMVEPQRKLVHGRAHEKHGTVLKAEITITDFEVVPGCKFFEALQLIAIIPAQPDLPPPSLVVVLRELVGGVGPQLTDSGASDRGDPLDEIGVLGLE